MVAAEVADAVVDGALLADSHPPAVHAAAQQVLGHRSVARSAALLACRCAVANPAASDSCSDDGSGGPPCFSCHFAGCISFRQLPVLMQALVAVAETDVDAVWLALTAAVEPPQGSPPLPECRRAQEVRLTSPRQPM